MAFEELPNKIKKRIEKRKVKRQELQHRKKVNIDLNQSSEVLLEKYKVAYGDSVDEAKLKEYIRHQKLIEEAKNKHRNKVKSN